MQSAVEEQAEEMMMMGLRMTRGVDEGEFWYRFGISLEEAFPRQIQKLIQEGLLEWVPMDRRHLRLTQGLAAGKPGFHGICWLSAASVIPQSPGFHTRWLNGWKLLQPVSSIDIETWHLHF